MSSEFSLRCVSISCLYLNIALHAAGMGTDWRVEEVPTVDP